MTIYRPHEFAELIGKSVQTPQRWDRERIPKAHRSKTNRKHYTHEQYLECVGQKAAPDKKDMVYSRVSSSGQKGDLSNQSSAAAMLCTDVVHVVSGGKVTPVSYEFSLQEGSGQEEKRARFCARLEAQMV